MKSARIQPSDCLFVLVIQEIINVVESNDTCVKISILP
jgi:hypothetical protein